MAVQAFVSTDNGYAKLLGELDWTLAGKQFYACLVKHGATVNQTNMTYETINATPADITATIDVAAGDRAVDVNSNKVRFNHGKLTFTAEGDLAGRYVVYLIGDWESPVNGDLAIGYVDLTGAAEDAESVNAEFSFTPHANGLFEVARAAA
jgi:hypothetical protein